MINASQVLDQTAPKAEGIVPTPQASGQAPQGQAPAQVPEAQKDDRVASRLEILMKREQQALARERAAKDEETKLQERLKKLEEFDQLKTNPKKALEALGLSYDQLTQSILKDGEIPPEVQIKRIEEKFDAFKTEQQKQEEQRIEQMKQAAKAQEERATKEFKGEISQFLKDNTSKYELISFEGYGEDDIYDVIDEHYSRTLKDAQRQFELGEIDETRVIGKIMSITEACDKVEQFLEQKYSKGREVSKIKSLWSAVPKGFINQAVEQAKQQQTPVKKQQTLTNQLSATPQPKPTHVLTDQERVAKAIAYAQSLKR